MREAAISYHLQPDAPLLDEVRRIADDQIAAAIRSLQSADDDLEGSVHDARKRFKKIRALLRLVRPGLGTTYKRENALFRDLGRSLAEVRDVQVMAQTTRKLAKSADNDAAVQLLAPVEKWCGERRARVIGRRQPAEQAAQCCEELSRVRRRLPSWQLKKADDPMSALAGGIRKTYKRARNRHDEAVVAPEPACLHEWRKRVKYHWYHCRLLREAWPAMMKPRIAALDALASRLGDEHDLAVLVATLRKEEPEGVPEANRRFAEGLAIRLGGELRQQAFAAAPKLFVERPDALADRLKRCWASAILIATRFPGAASSS